MTHRIPASIVALSLALLLVGQVRGEEVTGHSMGRTMAEMKFAPVPGLPTCANAAVQSGDPSKGGSILLSKIATGCTIPWHWHTPTENVMVVSGSGHIDMRDSGKSIKMSAGAFASMPSHHIHQFRCAAGPCLLFISSDAAFDIHYVDAQGAELTPDDALKAVKETAAK